MAKTTSRGIGVVALWAAAVAGCGGAPDPYGPAEASAPHAGGDVVEPPQASSAAASSPPASDPPSSAPSAGGAGAAGHGGAPAGGGLEGLPAPGGGLGGGEPASWKSGRVNTTIYEIRRPGSVLPPGTKVLLDQESVQVTALSPNKIWAQEADAPYGCENGGEQVAWRAVVIRPPQGAVAPQVGDRLRVEGEIAVEGTSRVVLATAIASKGPAATSYRPLCQRGAKGLLDARYEGLLVMTAGDSSELPWPDDDGWFQIDSCFGEVDGGVVTISPEIHPWAGFSPGWTRLTGVLVPGGQGLSLAPRSEDDVVGEQGDDVCL